MKESLIQTVLTAIIRIKLIINFVCINNCWLVFANRSVEILWNTVIEILCFLISRRYQFLAHRFLLHSRPNQCITQTSLNTMQIYQASAVGWESIEREWKPRWINLEMQRVQCGPGECIAVRRRIIHYFCAVNPHVFCCLRKTKLRS